MTLRGILLVARQEFRARLRAGRWQWLLAIWVAVIGGFSALARLDAGRTGIPAPLRGISLFGALMLAVLTLVLLVAPALTAHSVNGDRDRGTLATLQVTQLSAGDIAAGKLLSAWLTVLAALALTLPFAAWAIAIGGPGGAGAGRAAAAIATIAVLAAVLCAVGQACSTLLGPTVASTLMSYAAVFILTFGTLITFGLAAGLGSRGHGPARTDRVWWLLAPNPYAIVGDAAGRPAPQPAGGPVMVRPQIMVIGRGQCVVPGSAACAGQAAGHAGMRVFRLPPGGPLYREAGPPTATAGGHDPLSAIAAAVRAARRGPAGGAGGPVWPYGLAFDTLAGAGSLWVTIARLRTPAGPLPRWRRTA
jgi:ABC-type transport system involved in multi-copper enzyme maturation permease subunit